jgi:protein-arginine kinase activator protein McsA
MEIILPYTVYRGIIEKECPECGMKFSEYKETGFLGCPHCYKEFEKELAPYLEELAYGAE